MHRLLCAKPNSFFLLTLGGNVTLNEVFPNSPNLHKLLEMSRDFQDLMGVLAASVHTQQVNMH